MTARARLRALAQGDFQSRAFDALLALVLTGYGLGHVWLGFLAEEGYAGGPRWLNTLVVVLTTAPLAFRRRAPLFVLGTIMAALSLPQVFGHPMLSAYAGLLPALIASYTVARNEPGRRVLGGVAIVVAGLALLAAGSPHFRSANEWSFEAIVWSVAWLLGWGIQQRERRARELEGRTAHLERDRHERARAAVLDERARIARELHDVVAHGVSLMVVQAGAARLELPAGEATADADKSLRAIESIGRRSLTDLRRLLAVMRDDDEMLLAPLPGMEQLDELVAGAVNAGLPVELKIEGEPAALPGGVDLTAYRIVQEALTNAVKHSRDARAEVTIRYRPALLELEVVNDGIARSNGNGGATGHGLLGMRERVSLYGGNLEVGPRPDGGYAVRASLPLGEDDW